MLSEKQPSEELDDNIQKRLHKLIVQLFHYNRPIDPTMLMALNSLSVVKIKPKIGIEESVTQFLNHSATHPDSEIEYRRSGMIIRIYFDASYIS